MKIRRISCLLFLCTLVHAGGKEPPLIDMQAMRDAIAEARFAQFARDFRRDYLQ